MKTTRQLIESLEKVTGRKVKLNESTKQTYYIWYCQLDGNPEFPHNSELYKVSAERPEKAMYTVLKKNDQVFDTFEDELENIEDYFTNKWVENGLDLLHEEEFCAFISTKKFTHKDALSALENVMDLDEEEEEEDL